MNAPVTSERKSFLPSRLRSTTLVGSTSNIPTASHPTTPVIKSMSLNVQNDTSKSLSLPLGSRVLFNDLKIGTLRYIGTVEFAQGIFCGIELDEPEGKHDGQVNNIRYFQCKTDHGIFVPREKVTLAPRERANTIQRSIGPLKYPAIKRTMTMSSSTNNINNNEQSSIKHPAIKRTMTMSSSSTSINNNNNNNNNEQTPRKPSAIKRTMTISSSVNNNKNEQIPIKSSPKMTQLPDIIPNSSTSTQPVSIIKTNNNPIITDHDEIMTPTENIHSMTSIQSLTIDEIPETIVPDFTDSVSVLLHHLQQDEQLFPIQSRPSITISEEGTIDDDDDDDDDDDQSDVESINESILSEKLSLSSINNSTKSIQTDLSIDINENFKNLLNSTTSINELKINSVEYRNKEKPNLPIPSIKKILPERKLSISSDKTSMPSRKTSLTITNTSRKLSLTPPKPVGSTLIKPKSSLGSQSKLNRSLSSSTSVASSQSDLTTSPRKFSRISHLDKKPDILDPQLIIQKAVIQSLESNNEYLKKQYQHLLNQFDLMYTLNQYYINQNDQIKQEYEKKYSIFRIKINQLKTLIEQLKFAHEKELEKINEQNKNTINSIKQTHQQELKQSLNEKLEFETRCLALQKEVDRYMYEMENSEYADPLLRRVEILEKDRTSLETVLELRTQELTQLRTQMNEQVFVREDQLALQKRLDMAENRNQDLICLLRNWQLNELSVGVQCEQLKEQLTQLERDNRQLTFENETLLYTLRQRSPTISDNSFSAIIAQSKLPRPTRAHSFSCLITSIETNSIKYSSSLDCI